jgi:hypothetical protein
MGVYGLELRGLVTRESLLRPVIKDAPLVSVERDAGLPIPGGNAVTTNSAHVLLQGASGHACVSRHPLRVQFNVPDADDDAGLVHPYMALPAAIINRWFGRLAFHAGGFRVCDKGFGVLGQKGAGKSTLMAMLHLEGVEIVADDVLVVDKRTMFAGPASLDLRRDAAGRLGIGTPLGVVGQRERYRVQLPTGGPVSAEVHGWIVPAWGEQLRLTELSARDRLTTLHRNLALFDYGPDPESMLDLVALPMWRFERPRDWANAHATAQELIASLHR